MDHEPEGQPPRSRFNPREVNRPRVLQQILGDIVYCLTRVMAHTEDPESVAAMARLNDDLHNSRTEK